MSYGIGLVAKEDGAHIALKGVRVVASLGGAMAETRLEQRYRNDTDRHLEVAYTFPLPVGAVLLDFQVELDGKTYKGRLLPRQEAEERYEAALDQGDAAFRLQKLQDGLYGASLGNLAPGEEAVIGLAWVEVLFWNGDSLRYRLPTTIAPRYGEPAGLHPWQRPQADLTVEYPLSLEVRLHGELAAARCACPSHPLEFSVGGDTLVGTLARGFMDRDFVLEIRSEAGLSAGLSAPDGAGVLAMLQLVSRPAAGRSACAGERAKVIVLDCSGSMAGESLDHAKAGVLMALERLHPQDRFTVIGFGSRHVCLAGGLLKASPEHLEEARRFVANLSNMGGTELGGALWAAMDCGNGEALDILLLTDGETWEYRQIAGEAAGAGHRVFTMGIGSAVAEDTVRGLAEATGGACELLTPNEDMALRIARHFERMNQAAIVDVRVHWGVPVLWQTAPRNSVFAGDAASVFAAFEGEAPRRVWATLVFSSGASVEQEILLSDQAVLAPALVKLAAQARVAALPAGERQEWSLRYGLVGETTDYLLVVEREGDAKAEGLPELHVVPQMLAAGWGGVSRVDPVAMGLVSGSLPCCFRASRGTRLPGGFADVFYDMLPSGGWQGPVAASEPPAFAARARIEPPAPVSVLTLVERLNQKGSHRSGQGKGTTLDTLLALGLPTELADVFREAVAAGEKEAVVFWAFLSALAGHLFGRRLSQGFRRWLQKRTANMILPEPVLESFRLVLEGFRRKASSGALDDLKMPAFLRKQRDGITQEDKE